MGVKNTSNDYGMGKTTVSRNPELPNQLSRTPKNFSRDNYWLKEVQDQVDAYWAMRPNHVDVEQEMHFGQDDYETYEVVAQSVKDDKGQVISDDWRRFVFRDIHYDCPIGTKFKVSPGYDTGVAEEDKLIFLVFNKQNELTATNAVVVRRCNGTLGTPYLDEKGILKYHYEPAVQQSLSGTDFHYNKMANDPSGDLTIIVQHNEFTKKYYINQRFIIGYDRVYRIANIDKFYSNDTFHPENVGLISLHMSIDNIGERDDFENRIAFNEGNPVSRIGGNEIDDYIIVVKEMGIENGDGSMTKSKRSAKKSSSGPVDFITVNGEDYLDVYLYNGDERIETPVSMTYEISKVAEEEWSQYVDVLNIDGHLFRVVRKKYCAYNLIIKFYIDAAESPVGEEIDAIVTVDLSGILPSEPIEGDILVVGDVIKLEDSETLYRIVDRRGLNYMLLDISDADTTMFNLVPETIEFSNNILGQKYAGSLVDVAMRDYYEHLPNNIRDAIIPQEIYQDMWYYGEDGYPIYEGILNNGEERAYQVSDSDGEASIGERYCYAMSIAEVLKSLATTTDMNYENTTLRYDNLWKMFWFDQKGSITQFPCLRSAHAKNSLRMFVVDGRDGNLNGISYDYTFLMRPAFVIDLNMVKYEKVQDSALRSSNDCYFVTKK